MADHYFSSRPGSPQRRQQVAVSVWGHQLDLVTGAGVFAAGRLDLGTSVLFRATKPPTGAPTVLDLGCGYGVVALALAVAVPKATVWAVDVNLRALDLCADNARNHGVADRVMIRGPDDVPADVRFDEIWSNPPIRIGKPALHDLLAGWLPRLRADGTARLVVGKNLGADSLQRWISEQGYTCTRAASAKGFRVLEVRH